MAHHVAAAPKGAVLADRREDLAWAAGLSAAEREVVQEVLRLPGGE
ncbi:hypothetical protein [Streptomyces hoynatensis]|nr:hypothetical protein [Streptomyces hoynatensis]